MTKLNPVQMLSLRLLRAEGFSSGQIAEALDLDPAKVPSRGDHDSIRVATMQALGAPITNNSLFGELLAAAERYLGHLPAVAELRRSKPKGRQARTLAPADRQLAAALP